MHASDEFPGFHHVTDFDATLGHVEILSGEVLSAIVIGHQERINLASFGVSYSAPRRLRFLNVNASVLLRQV